MDLVQTYKTSIIALQETKLSKDTIHECQIKIFKKMMDNNTI